MDLHFLNKKEVEQLKSLEVYNFYQLLTYFPHKYKEEYKHLSIRDARRGDAATVTGEVVDLEHNDKHAKKTFVKAILDDGTGELEIVWWNSPFVLSLLQIGKVVSISGDVVEKLGKMSLSNPKIITGKNIKKVEAHNSLFKEEDKKKPLTAIYKDNKIIKTNVIKKLIGLALNTKDFEKLSDIIPKNVADTLKLPSLKQAILMKHFPKDEEMLKVANKFFAFQEIFILQVYREKEKALRQNELSHKIKISTKGEKDILKLLPFKLTNGQAKVFEQIKNDIEKDRPMSRLVEGDVGSGKTAIAILAMYAAVNTFIKDRDEKGRETSIEKRLQTAIMAPTEVLASQHFETFINILKDENINIALLAKNVGKVYPSKIDKNKATTLPKPKIKKLLEEGRIDILIGTHSVIQKTVQFKRLGLIVIDEQHRFGIKQRRNLIERSKGDVSIKIQIGRAHV